MKKILLTSLLLASLTTSSVFAGERMAKDTIKYDQSKSYTIQGLDGKEYQLANYFVEIYKDINNPVEDFVPCYNNGEEILFPTERIYKWREVKTNYEIDLSEYNHNVYNIGGRYFISKRG